MNEQGLSDILEADYLGVESGYNTDKLKNIGFTTTDAQMVHAPDIAYMGLLQNYQQTMSRFVGPTELLVSGDTPQLRDYSKLDWEWSIFDPEEKKRRHETVFPQECAKAYDMGAALIMNENV